MENGADIPRRVVDLEQETAGLAGVVDRLVNVVGMLNATLARLGLDSATPDLYDQRFSEVERDLKYLKEEIAGIWPQAD